MTATGSGWTSPSLSDDGTVYAFNSDDKRVHAFPPGTPEAAPISIDSGLGFESLDVAPDRSALAYMHLDVSPVDHTLRHNSDVTRLSDGHTSELLSAYWPAWEDARHVVLAGALGALAYDPVEDASRTWFDTRDWPHALEEAVITRAGDKAALRFDGAIVGSDPASRLGVSDIATPADPCESPAPVVAQKLTWSPDGTTLAWQQNDGIHELRVGSLATCDFTDLGLVIPGASWPDWGPSDDRRFPNAATPGPITSPGGGSTGAADASRARLALRAPLRVHRSRALAHGLRVHVTATRPCRVSGIATVSARIARRRHLRSRVVARGAVTIATSRATAMTLRFSKRARARLATGGSVILTLRATTDSTSAVASVRLARS